jgi:extradiol dioxygenase family protein
MLVENFTGNVTGCNGGEECENYCVLDYGHRVVWYRLTSLSRSVRPPS